MSINKILKLTALNAGIAVGDTVLFSPGLLGLQIGGVSVLGTAFGVTVILMSVVVFIYGNYKLLVEKQPMIQTSQIKTKEDFIAALISNSNKKTFGKDIEFILNQIRRFDKKKETINYILLQKFNQTEMSYQKFEGTIVGIKDVFYLNIRSILNRLNAFDEGEYDLVRKNNKEFSKILQTKKEIFEEYIAFVKSSINDNEEIILKMDKLLFEISKLNSLEGGDIEKMSIMSEIDELINQTKYYKEQSNMEGKGII